LPWRLLATYVDMLQAFTSSVEVFPNQKLMSSPLPKCMTQQSGGSGGGGWEGGFESVYKPNRW
jgi:hypothetical protein